MNGGGERRVCDMETKHLFYTWLMIWNHGVPPPLRVWDRHRYVFGPSYTKEYMPEAFRACYLELQVQDDLGPRMRAVMAEITAMVMATDYALPPP